MIGRIVDWLDQQPPARRRLYGTLLLIPLLTVPCYVTGVLLLVVGASPPDAEGAAGPVTATAEPTAAPTTAPIRRATPVDIGRLATATQQPTATEQPTELPTATISPTATDMPVPTAIELPTLEIIPLDTPTPLPPQPTDTLTPVPASDTPTPAFIVVTNTPEEP